MRRLLLVTFLALAAVAAIAAEPQTVTKAGTSASNAVAIQGVTGGVPLDVNATVTVGDVIATNPSVTSTGNTVPGQATFIAGSSSGNKLLAPYVMTSTPSGAEPGLVVRMPAGASGLTDAELRAAPLAVSSTAVGPGTATSTPFYVSTINTSGGGLTNAELRASPVPVQATVTSTTITGSVTVTGPLTNTELRAAPVSTSSTIVGGTVGVTGTFWPQSMTSTITSGVVTATLAAGSAVTSTISGTVSVTGTAYIGSTHALDGDRFAQEYAQNSTSTGQYAVPVMGMVTTAAPTRVNGQTSPLSLTTGGALRTSSTVTASDLTTIAGAAAAVGNGTAATSLRVALASDSTGIVNQGGTWTVGLSAGQAVTSTINGVPALANNASAYANGIPVLNAISKASPSSTTADRANALQISTAGRLFVDLGGLSTTSTISSGSVTATLAANSAVSSTIIGPLGSATKAQSVPIVFASDHNAVTSTISGNVAVTLTGQSVTSTGLAQGSTTSGQTGFLMMGTATSTPPTRTGDATYPLSLTLQGGLRTTGSDLSEYTTTATSTTATSLFQLVALSGSLKTYILNWKCSASGAATTTTDQQCLLKYGTGTACATGTTLLDGCFNPATGGCNGGQIVVPAGQAVCGIHAASGTKIYSVTYKQGL